MDEYLTTKYKDKDRVKSLGIRYNGSKKQWYVPAGLDLNPFLAWLQLLEKRSLPR